MLGERGINLSGGQKARVSIARGLYAYSDTDIFIFDDSLSAVDVHVSTAIFHEAFESLLAKKTRLVVLSSHYHFLSHFDKIIVIQDGRMAMCDTYSNVISAFPQYQVHASTSTPGLEQEEGQVGVGVGVGEEGGNVNIPTTVNTMNTPPLPSLDIATTTPIKTTQDTNTAPDAHKADGEAGKNLIKKEEVFQGAVTSSTYINFFSGATNNMNGYIAATLLLLLFAVCQVFRLAFDMWIGIWASNNAHRPEMLSTQAQPTHTHEFFYHWFIIIFCIFVVLCFYRAFMFTLLCLNCSRNLYEKLVFAIFHAPVNLYFDITPIGRILNRFSQDLDAVDTLLPDNFLLNLQNGFFVLCGFVMCIVVTPYFILLLAPLIYFIVYVQDYFRKTSRELKRLDRATRSPLFSMFGEAVSGLVIIRSFDKYNYIFDTTMTHIGNNMRHFYHFWMSNRWLAIRVDCISGIVVLGVSLFAVLVIEYGGSIDPNYVGYVIYNCVYIMTYP